MEAGSLSPVFDGPPPPVARIGRTTRMAELLFELVWFILDVLLSGIIDLSFEPKRRNPEQPPGPAFELSIAAGVAVGLGFISSQVIRQRLLPPLPRPGLSLVLAPLALGLTMHAWGRVRPGLRRHTSYLATWYGGAIMGFGLAAGRLLGLTYF